MNTLQNCYIGDLLFSNVQYIPTWPWIPNFPHAKVLKLKNVFSKFFVYFTYLEQKSSIQCVPVLVFHTYLSTMSLIWCGRRQTSKFNELTSPPNIIISRL